MTISYLQNLIIYYLSFKTVIMQILKMHLHRIKHIIICIVIFLSFYSGRPDIEPYFCLINNAEECIVDKKYEKALTIYEKAFNNYNSPHGNDYYNAALAALYARNENIAFEFLSETIKRGYTLEFLNNPVVNQLITDEKKWIQLQEKYDSLHNIYTQKTKTPIFKELNAMLIEEQKSTFNIYSDSSFQLTLDSLYLKNMTRIIELVEKDSLPVVEYFNMNSRKLQSIIPFIIVRHYFGMYNRALYYPDKYQDRLYQQVITYNPMVEKTLFELIQQGKLSPEFLLEAITYNNPKNLFGKQDYSYCRYITNEEDEDIMVELVLCIEDFSEEKVDTFNIHRKKWFLPEYNVAINYTKDLNSLPASITNYADKYFNYNGDLQPKGYFITDYDSLQFTKYCRDTLGANPNIKLEWIYLGPNSGWKLPK